jgi:hypothetical protein
MKDFFLATISKCLSMPGALHVLHCFKSDLARVLMVLHTPHAQGCFEITASPERGACLTYSTHHKLCFEIEHCRRGGRAPRTLCTISSALKLDPVYPLAIATLLAGQLLAFIRCI